MVINWYGLSCFKITSGNLTLTTDPYDKSSGLTAPRWNSDLVVISNPDASDYNNKQSVSGEQTFAIDGPGEFDVKGLFVRGIAAKGSTVKAGEFDPTTIYGIRMEDIRVGFLGSLKQKELTDKQLDDLGQVDILLIPVGAKSVADAEEAVKIVNQIEPKIVIPMHFDQSGIKQKLDKVDLFLKEIGAEKQSAQEKLTIKKSQLTESDKTEVIVLEPGR